MKKTTINKITSLLLMVILVFSCNQIKEEKSTVKEKIQNDKLEAVLIVKAAQQNLNTIALCDAVEKLEENQQIKNVATSIKQEQQKIFESLQYLASENMISVASEPTYQPDVLKYFKEENIVTTDILGNIKDKLETQILVLDTLRKQTDENNIEIAAKQYIKTLKENKELTQITLESLK
ncbi:hypothetical protein ACFO3O_16070 [Dokdonia ponticola]|uniref:DUF4142 domain-containing protein n=1 Tax=Dokdonia ponticola TaxID=2041041 RepID=A0ABV9HZZ2_9FLAO